MTKFFVKKPYFMIVTIIVALTIGFVSLSQMQTDLFPEMELPYMAVITTEVGASPEKVENDITSVMESTLGTINGVETMTSTSANNYSMVLLEFSEDTDVDAALVRVSKAVNALDLPDGCGTPNIMEVSADMMSTLTACMSYDGKDIKELSTLTDTKIVPYLEKQEGIASVSANGLIENTVEIRLSQDKIDEVNDKILESTNEKLKEASDKISDAEEKLEESKKELEDKESELGDKQTETNDKLADASTQLVKAQATKAAYEATLNSLKASQSALEAELKAYKKANVQKNYKTLNSAFAQFNTTLGAAAEQAGISIPADVKDAVDNKDKLEAFTKWVTSLGYGDQVKALTYDTLKQVYDIVEVRIPQINTELANLNTEIKAAEVVVKSVTEKMEGLDEKQGQATSSAYQATAGFGAGQAQLAAAKTQIKTAEKELKQAKKQLDESKKTAREKANVDTLISIDTLKTMLTAQNFAMPAGYIDDADDNQWLVEVGENFEDKEQISELVLTKIKNVGKIRVSDVADIVSVDNVGEQYTKINGEDAVMLSIYKSSTANTSAVSSAVQDAFQELEDEYEGLEISLLKDQGSFINRLVKSVTSSMLLGAVLAIIVLALFLKSIKPTLIVAFSIPFSVLSALIIMYFSGININAMSLMGLSLGIGMLVDNSIVVMENIFRLRGKGIPAPRAAVQGAKQVSGSIIASTVTTICVFLPMVYTSGMISQLLIPFCFTISYALIASLIVALTVIPALGSMLLKKANYREQKWFAGLQNVYAKALKFCLRYKVVPLAVAIILLVVSIKLTFSSGLSVMDDMDSNQISVSVTLEDDVTKEEAYQTADEVMEILMKVDGVDRIGGMDGNSGIMGSLSGGAGDNYTSFTFNVLTKDEIKKTAQFREIKADIREKTKDIACKEIKVSGSALGGGGASSMLSSGGVTVNIYGDEQEKLISISEDIMKMMGETEGLENPSNGQTEENKELQLTIDKSKAAAHGLTVAQIYQALSKRITTEQTAITMDMGDEEVDVNIVNETDLLTYENILDMEIDATTKNSSGEDVTKTYKLSEFAEKKEGQSLSNITRENQKQYLSVTADTTDGTNSTLVSRDLQSKIDEYQIPDGYSVEVAGEASQVSDMLKQMLQALALGFLLIYLVMVAQFQSFLSPFIIIFTVPLAFTGGMIGLKLFGQNISAMSLMGFMVLMGTVVNNGIVFVDYVNQLRIKGVKRHTALIATGKTRMRPILMTAMTTILSMSVMMFSKDAGNAMQKGMAIVVGTGLLYSTFMTLFIVPVMYDILYRKQPKEIDVGSDLDVIPDETEELLGEVVTPDADQTGELLGEA